MLERTEYADELWFVSSDYKCTLVLDMDATIAGTLPESTNSIGAAVSSVHAVDLPFQSRRQVVGGF